MPDSVSFTKEQISTFINAETIEEFADNMIKGYGHLDDCDALCIQLPIPRALYKAHLGNNTEEYAKQIMVICGQILKNHKLESEQK